MLQRLVLVADLSVSCSDFIDLVSFAFFDLAEDLVVSIAFCDLIGEKYKLFQLLFLRFLIVLFQFDGQIQRISLKHLLTPIFKFLIIYISQP